MAFQGDRSYTANQIKGPAQHHQEILRDDTQQSSLILPSSVNLGESSPAALTPDVSGGDTITIPVENVTQIELGNEQYVTILQNGQTYAIPLASFEAMQAETLLLSNQHQQNAENKEQTPPPSANTQAATREAPILKDNQTLDGKSVLKPKNQFIKKEKEDSTFGYMSSGQVLEKKPRFKIIPNLASIQKKSKEVETRYKPIKVDNWGIFLMDRLQSYFKRKDLCDVSIRFPDREYQIEAHKLILCACSEMFANADKDGELNSGRFLMPSSVVPEAMAQIIKFMYSGRLEVKEESFEHLLSTAKLLDMAVLAKLLQAQKDNPIPSLEKRPKRPLTEENSPDPLKAVKKFKRMETKVREQEVILEKLDKMKTLHKIKKEQEDLKNQRLPGKRLPIWKRKLDLQEHTQIPRNTENVEASPIAPSIIAVKTERHSERIISKQNSARNQTNLDKDSEKVVNTYQRKSPCDKPKIPRKLREMHEHLMFEKILKTGSKNTLFLKEQGEKNSSSTYETVDQEVEGVDIKDFSKEQETRAKMIQYEDDLGESYDNEEPDYSLAEDGDKDITTTDTSTVHAGTDTSSDVMESIDLTDNVDKAATFIQEEEGGNGEDAATELDFEDELTEDLGNKEVNEVQESKTPMVVNMQDASKVDIDDTLEDFDQEIQEEHEENTNEPNNKDLKAKNPPLHRAVDQDRIIKDILKKNPGLLKRNKPINLKVVVVENNKKTTQVVTIKPVESKAGDALKENQIARPMHGLKSIPKVCYSGKQGRPRQLRPGEKDPHALERKHIRETLLKTYPSIANIIHSEPSSKSELELTESLPPEETAAAKSDTQTSNLPTNVSEASQNQSSLQTEFITLTADQLQKLPAKLYSQLSPMKDVHPSTLQLLQHQPGAGVNQLGHVQAIQNHDLLKDPQIQITQGQLLVAKSEGVPIQNTNSSEIITSDIPSHKSQLLELPISNLVSSSSSSDGNLAQQLPEAGQTTANLSSVLSTTTGQNILSLAGLPQGQGLAAMASGQPGSGLISHPAGLVTLPDVSQQQQMPELIQMVDSSGQDAGKCYYVLDLKAINGLDPNTTTNNGAVVLPLPYLQVSPNMSTTNVGQSFAGINTSIVNTQSTISVADIGISDHQQPAASTSAVQQLSFDPSGLLPVSIGGISGVLPAAVGGNGQHAVGLQGNNSQLEPGYVIDKDNHNPRTAVATIQNYFTSPTPKESASSLVKRTLPVGSKLTPPGGQTILANSPQFLNPTTSITPHLPHMAVAAPQQHEQGRAVVLSGQGGGVKGVVGGGGVGGIGTIQINVPLPSAAVNASLPSTAVNAPLPSAAVNVPFPSAAVNATLPSAAVNAPLPSAAVNAPLPSTAVNVCLQQSQNPLTTSAAIGQDGRGQFIGVVEANPSHLGAINLASGHQVVMAPATQNEQQSSRQIEAKRDTLQKLEQDWDSE